MNDEAKKNPEQEAWLKKMQQDSWEPEVLLSCFVVIALLQLPDLVDAFALQAHGELLSGNLQGVFSGAKIAVYTLVTGLVIHLFLRGVWVGYIGLTYTFPKGIRADKLGFQPQFQRQIENIPSHVRQIETLEKICSSLFSACFFMMMCIVGVLVGIMVFLALIYLLDFLTQGTFDSLLLNYFGESFYDTVISIVVFFMAIDFVFVGIFRKQALLAKFFYPIHRFISLITLSFIYRPIFYTFASNLNRWYFTGFMLVFLLYTLVLQSNLQRTPDDPQLSRVSFYSSNLSTNFFSGYYADRNETWASFRAEIPSPILKDRFLELVLKHDVALESKMWTFCNLNEDSTNALGFVGDSLKLACIQQFYQVYLDDQPVDNPDWMFYFHQKQKRKSLITFIDTEALAPGKHLIEVRLNEAANVQYKTYFARILFFKE
jgi:hypothetical protein